MTPDYLILVQELRDAGVPVDDVWDLVNTRVQYPAAVPILLDWLSHRVPVEDIRMREGLVRALTIRAARPAAFPVLVHEFRTTEDDIYRWVVGNALSVVADASAYDELVAIILDRRYGWGRERLVEALWRFKKNPRTVPILLDLLNDPEATAWAVRALSRIKPAGIKARMAVLLDHPDPEVRKRAEKALPTLPD